MRRLSLTEARAILDGALAEAAALSRTPSIAVVDPAGDVIAFARMDGGRGVNASIACAKARGAAKFERDGREMMAAFERNPSFIWQTVAHFDGQLMFDTGSCIVRDADGTLLGAVAVSGASGEEDEVIARAGLRAAGLEQSSS